MKPRSENPKQEGPFAWQHREAAKIAGQYGPNHYAVYHALTHFQSAAGTDQKRRFAASYEQIASHIGASRATVARCLPDLAKAGLIRIFTGSNGAHRATRNTFCLLSISSLTQIRGSLTEILPVSIPQILPVSISERLKKRTKNKYDAPPQAAAVVLEKENDGTACSPLRGGSVPQRTEEQVSAYFRALREMNEK